MNKSFTLIEILVAVGIFSLVVAISVGLFISSVQVQRNSLVSQKLLDEAGYAFEYISRALRMARKDLTGGCLTSGGVKHNYGMINGGLRFLNYQGRCQEFFVENGQLKKREADDAAADFNETVPLTSAQLLVEQFNVGPADGWDQDDAEQPRVTLFLGIKSLGQIPQSQPELNLQTTISQRNLDVKE